MLYKDVAGQDEIKNFLVNSINNNQISHCYIFEGPKGMGKYDLSLVFAQSLLCKDFELDPCNVCSDCIKVNSMNHPDMHIVNNGENSIKREDIDELIESINKKPYESNKKVYIINNAHEMTIQAANTFLKTLEEPPGDSIIILLTNNINLLLPTIISRCQIIKFKNVNTGIIIKYLKEKYNEDEEKIILAANYSNGILNKAVNIINGKDNILEKRMEVIDIFNKIIKSDSEIIFEVENYFEVQKDNIDVVIEIFMVWIRDIIYVNHNIESLVINKDLVELANLHGTGIKVDSELIQYLQSARNNIKSNVNYKLIIDNMLLKIQEVFKI
ncbi:DNA polymerase III subunit delta' [Sedimentibacter sp. MB31-C6]|uniref:DNA polymerase III subunit delta' n=1 Tax=Sedimentibacter sp. MB31-C6 TaxID=3109366 RepID=UPI002DDCE570|nr:DNA polymerase III subunit delta' [Sedimentibacter sp. MB36-C1]WSI04352.1 DNA polymerase III subunit delta' [Sedimentibacter sp. MB36-C1]